MPDWIPFALSAGAMLAGVSYWGGRVATALEGIQATLARLATRQDECEVHIQQHENRLIKVETRLDHSP